MKSGNPNRCCEFISGDNELRFFSSAKNSLRPEKVTYLFGDNKGKAAAEKLPVAANNAGLRLHFKVDQETRIVN